MIAEPLDKLSARFDRPASSQVQGKHSNLTSRECPRAAAPGHQQQLRTIIPKPHSLPTDTPHELAGDLLRGADEIAEFIFGTRESRRKVYYLRMLPTARVSAWVDALRETFGSSELDRGAGKPGRTSCQLAR